MFTNSVNIRNMQTHMSLSISNACEQFTAIRYVMYSCKLYMHDQVIKMVMCAYPSGNGDGVCLVCASDRVESEEDARC